MTTTPLRTRAGRVGLMMVALTLLLVAAVVDLAHDGSLLRSVLVPEGGQTPAEHLVRGVRGGLDRPPR